MPARSVLDRCEIKRMDVAMSVAMDWAMLLVRWGVGVGWPLACWRQGVSPADGARQKGRWRSPAHTRGSIHGHTTPPQSLETTHRFDCMCLRDDLQCFRTPCCCVIQGHSLKPTILRPSHTASYIHLLRSSRLLLSRAEKGFNR